MNSVRATRVVVCMVDRKGNRTRMLSYILATIVGLGSAAFYMAAFFFPEVYRKGDFVWSGVGFFYALVLWFCAGQIGGAVLLGQTASVALVAWLGWQTLKLRRETTPLAEQTSTASISPEGISPTAIVEKITTVFKPGKKATTSPAPSPVSEMVTDATEIVSEAVTIISEAATEALETATEFLETKTAGDAVESTSPIEDIEDITDFPSTAIAQESPEAIPSVVPEPEEMRLAIPVNPTVDLPESTPIVATEGSLDDDLEDELDEIVSAPTPVPPSPTLSLQPKSRTVGFLTSLTTRLKGLLGKGKSKSTPPIGVTPPSSASMEEAVVISPSIASPESPKAMEVVVSEAVETTEVDPIVEVVVSEAVETTEVDPIVEVVVSEAVETTEAIPIVEVVVSEAVETTEAIPIVEEIVSEAVETTEAIPIVEEIVSEAVETTEVDPIVEVVVSEAVETTEVDPIVEVVVSEAVETIKIVVPEENIPDAEISPEKEASGFDEETPSSDETLPTSDKPKPKKKQR
jgi:Ycf66 protein N-terminus